MPKPKVLIVCPNATDKRELNAIQFNQKYTIHFHEYDETIIEKILCKVEGVTHALEPEQTLDELVRLCLENKIEGVVSTEDYPGCLLASALCKKVGLIGPSPESLMACQHKYYSRLMQKQCVPHATPDFRLMDPKTFDVLSLDMSFPIFVKPVKSKFSVYANQINDREALQTALKTAVPSDLFLQSMNWFVKQFAPFAENTNHLLAEALLEGEQITLEGYVAKGEVHVLGVVDSVMFPGTICFERFNYPSHLPLSVQQRMGEITKTVIEHIGLNNSLFNIEMMYNAEKDKISIIEINPRMSFQFADLFEKVDGTNSYQIAIDIALGKRPRVKKLAGDFRVASSFVLRRFENARVIRVPSVEEINALILNYPDARVEVFALKDQYLDTFKQDGKSFRYGLINIGAENEYALLAKYEACKRQLTFSFT